MRKLCKLVVIDDIIEHTNADSLELAIIGGWQCCVKKGEHRKGDIVFYVEVDAMLPLDNVDFVFLAGRSDRTVDGKQYSRIKTIKLRKELSQGLILPLNMDKVAYDLIEIMDQSTKLDGFIVSSLNDLVDFDSRYGIIKYEPFVAANMGGLPKGNFPAFIPKTDQERYQNLRRMYELSYVNADEYEVTYKLDGSSFTAYVNKDADGEYYTGVCSRNLELRLDQEGNTFVNLFHKLGLAQKLIDFAIEYDMCIAIQGEMVGPGIQSGFEGVDKVKLYVFSVYDIGDQYYKIPEVARNMVEALGLNYVPVFAESVTLPEYDHMQDYVTGKSGLNGKYREGLVFKNVNDGSQSFKGISNTYLIKTEA